MATKKLEITKSKLLLVEGQDEVNFFEVLLKNLNKYDDVQIIAVGGKDNFKNKFPALINAPGFSDVCSMLLIRDADENSDSAFQSISNLIAKHGYTVRKPNNFINTGEIDIAIYIMPENSMTGMLETLCLNILKPEYNLIMECVEHFFEELKEKPIDQPKNIAKAKCQVFLSCMPDIIHSIGLGATKGYWDMNHPAMSNLRDLLNKL